MFGQHYQQAIDELSVYAYQIGLDDLSPEVLDKACNSALRKCEFIPKVADIRREAGILSMNAYHNPQPDIIAQSMYEKTMNWLRDTDALRNISTETLPPIACYAMKCAGGREAMLSGDANDKEWAHKNFVKTYQETFEKLRDAGITTRDAAREALGLWGEGKPLDFEQLQAGEV